MRDFHPGEGYSVYFLVGVYRLDSETLTLYHVQLILQPYTKLDAENPYHIRDLLLLALYHY